MGKKFFAGWALWQQMTFVLACGIVVTVFIGLLKLWYDTRKIRKYTKVEKGKKVASTETTPEMLEAQPEGEKDVPFGIRAIESGIEIDGVWISRGNTPIGSVAGSSRSSMDVPRLPRNESNSSLDPPQRVHGSSSRGSSRAPSSFDRAVSAERLPDSRDSSPNRVNDIYQRGPPVASSARYSSLHVARNSRALYALEGSYPQGTPAYSNGQTSSSNSGKSSGRNSDESEYMQIPLDDRPYEPAYINPRQSAAPAAPIDPRTDLNLLQSHRLSHVAETGQLTPRVRRPGHSGEWASVGDNVRSPQDINTVNGIDYFVPRQKTPSPPLLPVAISAEVAISPERPHIPSSSAASDRRAADEARQSAPLLETYQPRGPQYEYENDTEPARQQVQTMQNQRQTQVLRKVNSGFEILRPGTFAPPSPEEEKPEGSEKRQSRRLQKKRRPSESSRTSHFVEDV